MSLLSLPQRLVEYILIPYLDIDLALKIFRHSQWSKVWNYYLVKFNWKPKRKETAMDCCQRNVCKLCQVCFEVPGTFSRYYDIKICKLCKSLPDYHMICKTTAKKKYTLSDKDISQLETWEVPNPYCSSKHMILMREKDVLRLLRNKHGIYSKIIFYDL